MIELRGNMEEGPLGLSFCLPFSSSRHMTAVEDLGKDPYSFRQLEDVLKRIHLLSILEWDVSQCYFPIIRRVGVTLGFPSPTVN